MRTAGTLVLLAAMAAGVGCAATDNPDCTVIIEDTTIDGNTMTVDGTFVTAQPLLELQQGSTHLTIAGVDDGQGHATFDLSDVGHGTWDYSFDASCYDENAKPNVKAPTGFFTR